MGNGEKVKKEGKGPCFTRVARDSTTRLINLWPLVHTSIPFSSVNAPFYGYSQLQLRIHETEESQNRGRSNDLDRTADPPVQRTAHQSTELRLLHK